MADIVIEKDQNLEFILRLNKKLHTMKSGTFTPNMSGKPFTVWHDEYTNKSLTPEETKNLLEIVKESMNYVIFPINTAMGFSVGFEVAEVQNSEKKMLLRFKESQLPEGYTFRKMSKYFMSQNNLLKAQMGGVEDIQNDRDHYDY